MDKNFLKGIIESLLFITDKPLSKEKILEIVNDLDIKEQQIEEIINELIADYIKFSSLEIRQVAEGYQIATKPQFAEYVRKLYKDRTLLRLSTAAVETLAIIAYRQPITKAEIEETRGVDSTGVLETLLEKKLIKIVGRKEVIGRPLLYGTTQEFLKYFGLNSLSDLPSLEQFIEQNIDIQESNQYDQNFLKNEDNKDFEFNNELQNIKNNVMDS